MKTNQIWHGVRMRVLAAGADPDAAPRHVTFPADWEETAAGALAALLPGDGPVRLPQAAEIWIGRADPDVAARLHFMLFRRQGAPDASLWRDERGAEARFVLNLPAFFDGGFETGLFDAAVEAAALGMAQAAPAARMLTLAVTDLDGFIAAHGLGYGSDHGRAVARLVLTRLRARLRALTADPRLEGRTLRTGAFAPGPADALLGAETGGIAPAFGPVGADGRLTRATFAYMAAARLSNAAALAAQLSGQSLFPIAGEAEHRAMRAAVADLLDVLPAEASAAPAAAAGAPLRGRRDLPARHAGYTQKATLGGHRIYVRTGEYPDGTLGEVSITLPKDGQAMRGLMEAFATAVSIGLQHGVPLSEFVDAFTQTRFGPSGAVEGDPAVPAATSAPDYVFRHLAANYLSQRDLPAAETDEPEAPLAPLPLPLDLPDDPRARRRNFRVVG